MLLDIETDFDHPGKYYNLGDTVTCKINVESIFKVKCKYVTVRFRCPYNKSRTEYFRLYKTAKQRNFTFASLDSVIGQKAENVVLQKGTNRFIVSCKLPNLSNNIFNHASVIRCSCKVTVKANWLPKRCCLDWFAVEPHTGAEEVIGQIENGANKLFKGIGKKFRTLF